MDEGGILIDLRGGDFIESDRSTDVAALVDLEQWHVGSPLEVVESRNRYVQNWLASQQQ
jgi:hypothetical protein